MSDAGILQGAHDIVFNNPYLNDNSTHDNSTHVNQTFHNNNTIVERERFVLNDI
ncbi:hypothetical protein P691DRAFT_769428 [Macrolepiota fuliginosa MF-IS2]|uniref:Uncharacterized protein n=1 Tax=Macrolepiota fuliginosa MF-IS2 TaxID=1400762 RepID=A0A9P5WVY8_9AGAR|nr:hypothetical protein P691DRAFT_769428 [Macrolepiota fuliginosa MF-IS2]